LYGLAPWRGGRREKVLTSKSEGEQSFFSLTRVNVGGPKWGQPLSHKEVDGENMRKEKKYNLNEPPSR